MRIIIIEEEKIIGDEVREKIEDEGNWVDWVRSIEKENE